MGLPEPPDNENHENLSTKEVDTVIASETDSDEEDSHTGYALIPVSDYESSDNEQEIEGESKKS